MPSVCDECPLRLYNTRGHNLKGVGNPYSGNCIVIPNVDYLAYKKGDISFSAQLKVIEDILSFSIGELESNLYVIPLIRCNEQISCEVDKLTYTRCLHYFANDVLNYDFKHILLLGSAARRFLNVNIQDSLDTMFVSERNRRYFVNYSPFISYMDNNLFEIFKKNLIKWYDCICNNYYPYKIIKV